MAHSIETSSSSPLTQLRQDLAELEKLLVKVNARHLVRILELLDLCFEAMHNLRQQGVDLKGEEGLWTGFEFKLQRSAGQFVKAAKSHGGLSTLRSSHPGSTEFWWHLDDTYRAQNRKELRKGLHWGGFAVGVIATIYIMLTQVFPPDKNAILVGSVLHELETMVNVQEYQGALDLIEENLEASLRSEELLIWAGILEEQLGNPESTVTYFAEAFNTPALSPARVWGTIGTNRLRIGDLEGAECSGLAALEIDPEFPLGNFLIAGVAEAMGNTARAVEYFNLTADYAFEKEPQIAVVARVRLGYLMQSLAIVSTEEEVMEFDCTFPRGSR